MIATVSTVEFDLSGITQKPNHYWMRLDDNCSRMSMYLTNFTIH